jgi:Transcriptional regulatory protein, C terminal
MPSEPTLAKLLQEAVDAGHVVFVHTPKPPPTPPIVPLDERDEASLAAALGLVFKLSPSESCILANLMRREHCSREDLRAIASYSATATSIVSVLVCSLRKKLKSYSVEIYTIRKLGYGLDKRARDRIQKILAAHDEAILAARLKSETIEP